MNYTAEDIGRQLRGRRRRNQRGEYWEISGYCHGSEDKRDSNSLNTWDYKGSVAVRCWAGCDRAQIRAAIERATGWTIWPSRTDRGGAGTFPSTSPRTTRHQNGATRSTQGRDWQTEAEVVAYVRRVWNAAEDIPPDPAHPARKWLHNRKRSAPGPALWWSSLPVPPVVRFLPTFPTDGFPYGKRPPRCAAVVALRATPEDLQLSWPTLPPVVGVELCFVDDQGRPMEPLGPGTGNKRSWGMKAGSAVLIGDPAPDDSGLIVVEGLADGLALAARRWETVLVMAGVPPTDGPLFEYVAQWPAITLYADNEPTGRRAVRLCGAALGAHGVEVAAVRLPRHKDFADFAEAGGEPLADLAPVRADIIVLAADLQQEGLPEWESLRRAAQLITPREEP